MTDNYSVYKHTTPSGKVYIGITGQKVEYRWNGGKGYAGNSYFSRAIKKYGWDNITHEVLYEHLTKEEAERAERELIASYQSNNPEHGYNHASGGSVNAGFKLSEETKDKIRNSRLGANNPMYGRTTWNKGLHWSDEMKQRLSEKEKGKRLSAETKRRIGNALKGERSPLAKAVINLDTNEVYPAMSIAAEKTHIPKPCIYSACKGIQKTAGGYHWAYAL